jgi:hypothetical protein
VWVVVVVVDGMEVVVVDLMEVVVGVDAMEVAFGCNGCSGGGCNGGVGGS